LPSKHKFHRPAGGTEDHRERLWPRGQSAPLLPHQVRLAGREGCLSGQRLRLV